MGQSETTATAQLIVARPRIPATLPVTVTVTVAVAVTVLVACSGSSSEPSTMSPRRRSRRKLAALLFSPVSRGSSVRGMRTPGLVCAALLLVALVGCTPAAETPGDGTAAPPATSSTPTAAPTGASGDPAPPTSIVLPECEQLLPLATAQALFSSNTESFGELEPSALEGVMSGPASATAVTGALAARGCLWGIPNSDGGFFVVASHITPEAKATLAAALVEGGYAASTVDGAERYALGWDGEVGADGAVHTFVGDIWICARHTSVDILSAVSDSALAAVKTANPGIGG